MRKFFKIVTIGKNIFLGGLVVFSLFTSCEEDKSDQVASTNHSAGSVNVADNTTNLND